MDETHRQLVRSWLTKAAGNLRSARVLSNDPEGPLDVAIYHCQQGAEKAVKSFLVFKEITPEKTHDIRKLAVEASAIEPRFDKFVPAAAALTPYAWEFRYPDDLSETMPTREEFDEALKQAREIYDFVLSLLPEETRP
ncbi:MAG TPA: HEPN domain-containing protein [Verrucomicrobiae bacterium]|jgi:HEPN domain-containing protein|nr:HEPN domain-containing protein [Verrucomicrobiae bacterium]